MQKTSSAAYADSKPHYELLDGLRGVAALLVIWYHVFEGFAFAGGGLITTINHGYLAVDFFFMLSGFVIAYAYDDRWRKGTLTLKGFFKRRLIRLHPMVLMGALVGLASYLAQGGVKWDGTEVSLGWTLAALLCAMLFIPAWPGARMDVRGNGEMFPLNSPAWSLFFEYIGNVLYAVVRRLSGKALAVLTAVLGVALAWFTTQDAAGYGMFGVGRTLDGANFWGGLIRMMFPFTMGMLIQRYFRPARIRGAFWICSAIFGGRVPRALHPRLRGRLPERCLRGGVHPLRLPRPHPGGGIGHHDRPLLYPHLQVLGRHILPPLHHALSADVLLLRLAHPHRAIHLGRDLAGGRDGVLMLYIIVLHLPEMLR